MVGFRGQVPLVALQVLDVDLHYRRVLLERGDFLGFTLEHPIGRLVWAGLLGRDRRHRGEGHASCAKDCF